MGSKVQSLAGHLANLPDPRKTRGQRHDLLDIILVAILAVMCGADSWEDIYRFGQLQEGWLRTFLKLPNGMLPSYCFSHSWLFCLSF